MESITHVAKKLGIKQYRDADDYIVPAWPREIWNHHRIYFVRAAETSAVKIGFSTDVAKRLKQLQTGSPQRLVLEMMIVGTHALEAELHRRLKYHKVHLRGEWFDLDADGVKWIVADIGADGLVA